MNISAPEDTKERALFLSWIEEWAMVNGREHLTPEAKSIAWDVWLHLCARVSTPATELKTPKHYDHQVQCAINEKHVAEPQPGDYWHECFSPYHVVLAVDGDAVTICDKTLSVGKSQWTFDLSVIKTVSRSELRALARYGVIDGWIASVVVGGSCMTFVDDYRAMLAAT